MRSRLAAIKADIVANLQDGNLNATMIATRNRVTVRYLHKLFQNGASPTRNSCSASAWRGPMVF